MTFSEKMRESLGAEGVRLELGVPAQHLSPGRPAAATVTMSGGTKPARVDSLLVRVIEADRHWLDADGRRLPEDEVRDLADRRHLTAGWDRTMVGETRVEVGTALEPGDQTPFQIEVEVPSSCQPSAVHRAHILNVQADVKGQIDPTANARILVGSPDQDQD